MRARHIYGSQTRNIYYFIKETSIESITKHSPAPFTITINALGATQLKVMVLAMGYSPQHDKSGTGKLDENTNLSNYTFVVPEIATILLALAPIAGLCLYTHKQKKTNKKTLKLYSS